MNTYMSGSLVRTTAVFANASGANVSPTPVLLRYRAGAGSTVSISAPINDAVGIYHWDIDTSGWTGPGNLLYVIEWSGTGAVQAIDADYWEVEPAAL